MNLKHVRREFAWWWACIQAGPEHHWYDWPMHILVTTLRELAYTLAHVGVYGGLLYGAIQCAF